MKVLIVDDEPLARNELHYLLKENAMVNQIDEADGAMTADQKVNATHPDLVFWISNWMMVMAWHWLDAGKNCPSRQQLFSQPLMTITRSRLLMKRPLTMF